MCGNVLRHGQITITSWTQTGHVMSRTQTGHVTSRTHRQVMSCHGHRQVTVTSWTQTGHVMSRTQTGHSQVTDTHIMSWSGHGHTDRSQTQSSLPSHIWYFTDLKNTTSLLLFLPYMIFCLTFRLERHAYAQRPFEK